MIRACLGAVLYVLLVTVFFVSGFNLNWNYARVFSDQNQGSYFGYTVAFRRDGNEHKLLVGAPRGAPPASDSSFKMQDIVEPGVAFQCTINSNACSLLKLDVKGNIKVNPLKITHKKDREWFGGAMAVKDGGQRTVVCAPKWKNSFNVGHYLMNGICYMSDEPTYEPRTRTLLPLIDRGKQSYNHTTKKEIIFNYAYGEAGFTAHFPKDSEELILGAPGVFDWKGTVIRYKNPNKNNDSEVPAVAYTRELFENNYLGYSLSSGVFFKDSSSTKRHHYVSGAPRAADYKGKVFVFDFPVIKDDHLDIKFTFEGTQMGEYFGASLCVADLNGDGLDDLIVGAPQYSLKTQNAALSMGDEGRIYVFMNEDRGVMKEVTENMRIMGSKTHGARFGTAVANVGDLNYDGLEDIAVGAPYEGNGVVYIYHGRRSGSPGAPLELVQTIEASNISPAISGLGISFSKGEDIDKNYYNDIAVGAFESGHAVLLRGHPIIVFHASLTPSVKMITNKTKDFNVNVCLKYTGAYAPERVDSVMSLRVDGSTSYGRGVITANGLSAINYTDILRNSSDSCRSVNIKIKDEIKDPTKPIDVVMHFDLKYDPADQKPILNPSGRDNFCRDCPVVDKYQSKTRTIKVPFETGCKNDVCNPDLTVSVKFTGVTDKVILGVHNTLEMVVEVVNKGDPAFLPEVKIYLPNETPLVRYPQNCQNSQLDEKPERHVLKCDVGNSLVKNSTIKLQLDMKDVSVAERQLVFEVNATSSGEEATPGDNYKKVTLELSVESDMTITGLSSREQIVYVAQNNSIIKDLSVNYTFEVWNIGPSRVDKAEFTFDFPFLYYNATWEEILDLYEPKSTLLYNQNSEPVACHIDDSFTFKQTGNNDETYVPIEFGPIEPEETFPEHHQPEARSRVRRSTQGVEYFKMTAQTPLNKTLFLNCGDKNVQCATVTCEAGPFYANKSRAILTFPMNLKNLQHMEGELATKEIILFSARGAVTVNYVPDGKRPDAVIVQTMYLGKVNVADGGVPSWIIAVAIICGLLILCLIAMLLHKMGFFKRSKKDELEALKEAEAEAEADE